MKQVPILCLLGALVFSSCETIVEVDTPPHTPRLALTYTLSNQAPTAEYQKFFTGRELFVSVSQGVLEVKQPAGRGDASVELINEAGQTVEQFRSKARQGHNYTTGRPDSVYGYYVPVRGFVGEPGRTYTLRAAVPGIEAVEATLTMPTRATIETGSYVSSTPPSPFIRGTAGRLTCSILDNVATTDYYIAHARVLDRNGTYWGYIRLDYNSNNGNNSEINLNRFQLSEGSNLYSQSPFSDAGGNGQRLNLSNDILMQYDGSYGPGGTYPEPGFIEVIVGTITPDTYRFYQSLNRYYDTDGNPFAEPAPLFSNMRPGYGLFGGATDATYRIPL
ncbi:DUF4249 domain-containing protein [Hymenobacter tibetensis]|uniref:DUF4249 domain-containing protein n=1 Tax=Hymenobacter tibetensis TaxID=497967 RepID=A0ABY4D094_9BACT|nr:DUF4249 domain-containing protein [Hymenobacter tibetensis]UOG75757.1 DUF4249 domain-containing protein [Hymenobacter tibetensis]